MRKKRVPDFEWGAGSHCTERTGTQEGIPGRGSGREKAGRGSPGSSRVDGEQDKFGSIGGNQTGRMDLQCQVKSVLFIFYLGERLFQRVSDRGMETGGGRTSEKAIAIIRRWGCELGQGQEPGPAEGRVLESFPRLNLPTDKRLGHLFDEE